MSSAEELAKKLNCSRQTVEEHRRRGEAHFAQWTAEKLGQPWGCRAKRSRWGNCYEFRYFPLPR